MAEPKWYEMGQAAANKIDELTAEPKPKKEKSFLTRATQQLKETGAGLVGGLVGVGSETGRFIGDVTSTPLSDYNPFKSFPEFFKGVEDIRKGRIDITKAPQAGGKERVLQGLVGPSGPQGVRDREGKLKDSPLYDAAKRDLLNIGEGLVDVAAAMAGINNERQAAEAERMSKDPRFKGKDIGTQAAFTAGAKAGQELVGGLLATPAIAAIGTKDIFTGEEGKKLYREAPVAYALSLLPVLKSIRAGVKAGTIGLKQRALVKQQLRKVTNPATGKPFGSLSQLEAYLTNLEKQGQGGLVPKPRPITDPATIAREAAVQVEKAPTTIAAQEAAGMAGRAVKGAVIGQAIGGPLGAVAGGVVTAGPTLARAGNALLGKFSKSAAAKATAKAAQVKRGVSEPRTYESPQAEEAGEAAIRKGGEARVMEAQTRGLARVAVPREGTKAPTLEQFKATLKAEGRNPAGIPNEAFDALPLAEQESLFRQEYNKAYPTTEFRVQVQPVTIEASPDAVSVKTGNRFQQTYEPAGTTLQFIEKAFEGTELARDTLAKRRLATALAASKDFPVLRLIDPAVRRQVIKNYERITGEKASPELNLQLEELAKKAYEQGEQGAVINPQDITIKGKPLDDFMPEQTTQQVNNSIIQEFIARTQERLQQAEIEKGSTVGPKSVDFTNLRQSFQDNPQPDLAGVPNKTAALEAVNKELLTEQPEPYKNYLLTLKSQLETMEGDKPAMAGGVRQAIKTDPYRPAETLSFLEAPLSNLLGLTKRMITTYNPAVILGNYLGNAMVGTLFGKGDPVTLTTRAVIATRGFNNRVRQAGKGGRLSLADELTLRAVPRETMASVETGGAVLKPAKLVQRVYEGGDIAFKVEEGLVQSKKLITVMEGLEQGESVGLRVGPNQSVVVVKTNKGTIQVINPKTGNIVTEGNLNSAKVKQVLAAAVKSSIDAKYPDVSQLPLYFKELVRQRQAKGVKGAAQTLASAIVFTPFISYILKAADGPFRRGILDYIAGMDDSPILYRTKSPVSKRGFGDTLANSFDKEVRNKVARYAASRGFINSFYARYNEASAKERDQIRQQFAFLPKEKKAVVLGQMYETTDGDRTRRVSTPSYATFWGQTDNVFRAIIGVGNSLKDAFGLTDKELTKAIGSPNPELDKTLLSLASGERPDYTDILTATRLGGGLYKDLFVKMIDSQRLGTPAPDLGKELLRTSGVLGKLVEVVGTATGLKEKPNQPQYLDNSFRFYVDKMVSSRVLDPAATTKTVLFQTRGLYNEFFKTIINPLIEKAAEAERRGEDGDAYIDKAEELNDALQEAIMNKIDSRLETLEKLGLPADVRLKQIKQAFRKVREREPAPQVIEKKVEVQPEAPEPPPFPEFEEGGEEIR